MCDALHERNGAHELGLSSCSPKGLQRSLRRDIRGFAITGANLLRGLPSSLSCWMARQVHPLDVATPKRKWAALSRPPISPSSHVLGPLVLRQQGGRLLWNHPYDSGA